MPLSRGIATPCDMSMGLLGENFNLPPTKSIVTWRSARASEPRIISTALPSGAISVAKSRLVASSRGRCNAPTRNPSKATVSAWISPVVPTTRPWSTTLRFLAGRMSIADADAPVSSKARIGVPSDWVTSRKISPSFCSIVDRRVSGSHTISTRSDEQTRIHGPRACITLFDRVRRLEEVSTQKQGRGYARHMLSQIWRQYCRIALDPH